MGIKRIFAVFMSAVLAFSLTPAASLKAFADNLAAGAVDLASYAATGDTTQIGECNWTFDSATGTLTISPAIPGTTAELTTPDYYPVDRDEVKKLVFDGSLSISDYAPDHEYLESLFSRFKKMIAIQATPSATVKVSGDLSYMFAWCESLTDISGLAVWDTSYVTIMYGMFIAAPIKTVAALAKWDTSKVLNMDRMFSGCTKLSDISGLVSWDVSNASSLYETFRECCSLENLSALSKWDTSQVQGMKRTFYGCTSLRTVTGLSRWNTSSTVDMDGMFEECKSIRSVAGLSRWNTSRVRGVYGMFSGCTALTDLTGLAKWDTRKVQPYGMEYMFRDCPVTKISLGPKWRFPLIGNGALRIGIGEMGNAWFDLKWTSRNAKKKGPISTNDLIYRWKPSVMAGTWRVSRIPISKASIRVSNVAYRGKAACPEPRVKMKSTYGAALTLKKGRDYTVSYRNNKKVGKATAIITGKGWFKGTKKVTFRITGASASSTSKATQNKKALAAYKKLLSKRSIRWGNAYSSVNLPTRSLKFAVQDINKDGVSELVLSSKDAYHAVGYKRIYTYANGKLRSLGNYTDVSVYRNKNYFRHTSGGMGDFTEVYYRLGKDGKKTMLAQREVTVNDGALYGYNGLGFKTGRWSGYGKAWFYNYKVGGKSVSATEGQAYISKLTKGAKQTLSFHGNTSKNRVRYLKAK